MLLIQPGFGLSIKKWHMFGEKESQRKMVLIKLPFISICWPNREAANYLSTCARAAFNDPDWFVENHHAVRQAKRKAKTTYMKAYRKACVTNGAIVIHPQRLKSDPGGNLLS